MGGDDEDLLRVIQAKDSHKVKLYFLVYGSIERQSVAIESIKFWPQDKYSRRGGL